MSESRPLAGAPQRERLPVQRQGGGRIVGLCLRGQRCPAFGAGQPRRAGVAEAVRRGVAAPRIGTRQPSRPRTASPERKNLGSCRQSSGRSSTSGSPSSSPWYGQTEPGSASISRAAAPGTVPAAVPGQVPPTVVIGQYPGGRRAHGGGGGQAAGDGLPHRRCGPGRLEQVEAERLVQFVGAT